MEGKEYIISWGQIYLSKPTMTEADGETGILFPKEARLRNLTCARRSLAPLLCLSCSSQDSLGRTAASAQDPATSAET